jgi:hypothetical protein
MELLEPEPGDSPVVTNWRAKVSCTIWAWLTRWTTEGAGTRTLDLRLKRPLLYRLSYTLNVFIPSLRLL